ncbi:hypothetical protein PSU4_17100 [Pseudonocardia sulfidoxydans NBRC 16205]|uniref:Uncharacterized protein n=1 Tax=Pseudonocardia sulfidoxydans NBRC 16205 TaxID=1223511 RepID=A0A511DD77_9PSEU|nr:hypothetical protein [Pseudonocardia sulfidoxydans]GEL22756.1 hypothetical protein PSU4_17100 [Pseudonocardia sulfidoxydans NBRC 16205]
MATAWSDDKDLSSVVGTHRLARVAITYDRLVRAFGKPEHGLDYKTEVEWHISTPFGLGTIYDFTYGDYPGPSVPERITRWSIGGHNDATGTYMLRLIEAAGGEPA